MARPSSLHGILSLTLLVAMTGCRSAAPAPFESPVQTRMFGHFALARDLRSFIVNGDLERLGVTAGELSTAEETWGLPPGSQSYVDAVHDAARAAAEASDLAAASNAVADVAMACGACHLANQTTLGSRFQVAEPLLSDPATRHANYLSWVSRLLWDGLIGPSEAMWRTGAGALAGGEGVPRPRAAFVPEAEISRSAERFKSLGVEAVTAVDAAARARILSSIWVECAGCHMQAGVR